MKLRGITDKGMKRLSRVLGQDSSVSFDLEDEYDLIGWRYLSKDFSQEPEVGDVLDPSFTWDGDEPTDEVLKGTSAFRTRKEVENFAKYSRGGGWLIEIGGDFRGYGDEPGEVLIENAVVLSVEAW